MLRPLILAAVTLAAVAGTLSAVQPVPAAPPAAQLVPPGVIIPGTPPPIERKAVPKKTRPAAPRREVRTGPPEFEAKLVDDSMIKVVTLDSTVTMRTKYGKLTVPLADVQRLEIGFRYPEGMESRVDAAVANLGAESFRDRENAEKALTQMAEYALPALRRAAKSPDAEVSRRAGSLVKKLLDKLPAEKVVMKDYDLIETPEVSVRGRVESPTVKVKTLLSGETTLKLTDLRSLRSTAAALDELAVDAARFAIPNNVEWFDSGIDVSNDRPLAITATGTIDLGPNQPGRYMSTPTGNTQNGYGAMLMTPNGRAYRYPPGALVARVGSDGTPFVVGTNHKSAHAPGTGRLYLKIVPSAWGQHASGSYKVKVKVGG
jgi:hypothetical protein